MPGRHHHQLVPRQGRAGQVRALYRAFDEAKLGHAALDRRRHLHRIANGEADLDLGIGPPKGHEVPGQPVIGDRLTGLHGERAALQAAELPQRQLGRFGPRQHGPRLGEKDLPRLGQLDTPPHPIEQLGIVPRLQRRDRLARRGLRDVQGARGLRHMLPLGDGDKDAKLLQRHADILYEDLPLEAAWKPLIISRF